MRTLSILLPILTLLLLSSPSLADDASKAARLEKMMAFAQKVAGGDPIDLVITLFLEARRSALLQAAPDAQDNINRYIDHHLRRELMVYEPVMRDHMLAGFAEVFTDEEIDYFVKGGDITEPKVAARLEEHLPKLKAEWLRELSTIVTAAS